MDKDQAKVVDISKFSKNKPKELAAEELNKDNSELLKYGAEVFMGELEGAEGFLSVTLNEEGVPSIIWAGNVDTIRILGSLDVARQLFVDKTIYGTEDDDY